MTPSDHPTILLVLDDPARLLALHSLLAQWQQAEGYLIIEADSPAAAMCLLQDHDPALILQQADLLGMDHFAAAAAHVPIIFVSDDPTDEARCLQAYQHGAVDYLHAPLVPEILHAKVRAFVRLARQSRDKDEFLATLGHELRNPLSAIASAATILCFKQPIAPDKADRAKAIIDRQSSHLAHMLDDLLDLGRAISGKLPLIRQPLELAGLIESCVTSFHTSGRLQNCSLDVALQPAWVYGDPAWLAQIVSRLLDHALQNPPAGGRLEIISQCDQQHVAFCIRNAEGDVGQGRPANLFDAFAQKENWLDSARRRSGIGAALIRRLVTLHEGSFAASAGSDAGSVFTVRLPLFFDPIEPTSEA